MTSVLHDAGIGVERSYLVDRRHRAGPTGGRRGRRGGRLWRKLNFGHRQRSRRQYPLRCVSWTARIRSSRAPRLEQQQPDEYAKHSMKEKEQWYCRQDVVGTGP